ncbi:HlyC/CorC family transporter [Christensenellaceae bacterium NSJ-44]|uniref:HlyC/CorC family transporter n=1 Tax=Luoshenia tenuis TaxID=2763654 RepID=A0A926CXE2_9FIRM|nr:HlyC/CorC family transporter [Luoshenia tenuis]
MWSQLLLQVVLIALNAFFAATEIAVISLNENKLRHQAEQGDKKAKQMLRMVQTPAGFLSTIQIGITLAGFLASAFAAENFSDKLVQFLVKDCGFTVLPEQTLDVISIIVITLILSYFTLVLGELVPKRVAMKRSEKVARAASGVIHFLSVVMKPIVWLLSVSTNGVLRLMRIDPAEKEEAVTEEEIRLMVDIGQERGTIAADEREMIDNIFEFNNTTAEEIMIHRTDMSVIGLDDTPADILALIEETGLSRFPVYGEDIDDIRGIVSTRQFLLNQRHENPLPLSKIMRPAYFVPESVRADILFREMQKTKTHLAIVVDEYGGTSGLVTMEDLLEEIVGNIYDEFDPQDVQELQPLAENLWRVSGGIDLESLGEALEMELPTEEEYDTLGGLVFSQLTAIPEDGSRVTVEVAGLHIEVEELIEHRVEWALVSKLPPQTPPEESEGEH